MQLLTEAKRRGVPENREHLSGRRLAHAYCNHGEPSCLRGIYRCDRCNERRRQSISSARLGISGDSACLRKARALRSRQTVAHSEQQSRLQRSRAQRPLCNAGLASGFAFSDAGDCRARTSTERLRLWLLPPAHRPGTTGKCFPRRPARGLHRATGRGLQERSTSQRVARILSAHRLHDPRGGVCHRGRSRIRRGHISRSSN